MNDTIKDYEIKNGWILCKLAVNDKKKDEMGIDSLEWIRFSMKISKIDAFRECDDDGEYAGCSTIDTPHETFTVTVPFDVLIKLCVAEDTELVEKSLKW